MKEYLFTIVCIAVVDLLTCFISVSANNGSLDRYIKIALKLCMLSVVAYPTISEEGIGHIFDTVQIEQKYSDEGVLAENSMYILERECEERISEEIFQKTGIKPISVSIQIERKNEGNSISIEKASLKLPKGSETQEEELIKIAKDGLNKEVEIEYVD